MTADGVWLFLPDGLTIRMFFEAGMLDVVGFDAAAPALIADFVRA